MAKSVSRRDRIPGDRAVFRSFSRGSRTQRAESDCGPTLSVTLDGQELDCNEVQGSV